jgi:hypothetical protein
MIGARVIKTSLAVSLSVLTARMLDLHTPLFAGIVSVLSVQPSIFRSIRLGMQQTVSAAVGSLLGALCMQAFGVSPLVVGIVALVLMALHVLLKRAQMLLISVVCAINTMGAVNLGFLHAAWNEILLVLIGVGIGTLVNSLHKPKHIDRAEDLLRRAEGMLRALLHWICLDFKNHQIPPYPIIREQIDQVRAYIEKGKEISRLMMEDGSDGDMSGESVLVVFQTLESGVERIRDMVKALQGDVRLPNELVFAERVIQVMIRLQERAFHSGNARTDRIRQVIERRRRGLWMGEAARGDFESRLAFYNFYGYLLEYLQLSESWCHPEKTGFLADRRNGASVKISF